MGQGPIWVPISASPTPLRMALSSSRALSYKVAMEIKKPESARPNDAPPKTRKVWQTPRITAQTAFEDARKLPFPTDLIFTGPS
jgi:hypothetical protein